MCLIDIGPWWYKYCIENGVDTSGIKIFLYRSRLGDVCISLCLMTIVWYRPFEIVAKGDYCIPQWNHNIYLMYGVKL